MKFCVFALLVLACFEGFYCAPFLEIFIPESSQMSFGRHTTLDIPKLAHFENSRGFNWKVKWPERYPRQQNYGYPQQSHRYPQQYNDYPQQYEDYQQNGPYNNYGGQ